MVHWGSLALRLVPTAKQEASRVPYPLEVSWASSDSLCAFSAYRDPRMKSLEKSSHHNFLNLTSTPEAMRADSKLMRSWLGFHNQESLLTWVRASRISWETHEEAELWLRRRLDLMNRCGADQLLEGLGREEKHLDVEVSFSAGHSLGYFNLV